MGRVKATDLAGSESASVSRSVTVDYAAPQVPLIGTVADDDKVNLSEKNASVTVRSTAEVGGKVRVAWGSVERTADVGSDGAWTANFGSGEVPADGNSTIIAKVTDAAGNESAVGTRAVAVEAVAPVVTVEWTTTAPMSDGTLQLSETWAKSNIDVLNVIVGDTSIANGIVTLIGTVGTLVRNIQGNATISLSRAELAVLGDGAVVVRTTITDAAGNSSSSNAGAFTLRLDPEIDAARIEFGEVDDSLGQAVTVTADMFDITDLDTAAADIMIRLSNVPAGFEFRLNGTAVTSFAFG
ncbi:hypothetical protein SAMN05660489_06399 [Pseudomonas sp. LAMO17WK12:I10]|uniref:Ig-like domain repeat protein n=1 Tax=unclassified Pseudomonas TaxID=196821 RepID=UPI000BC6BF69|nr:MULTISPECIES: Ig-like domain repeat protein [unclassified Pseudomonas]PXX49360.1 hypothetical protein H160_06419 [Pseudomonas sp. LAMO17WK12:I9]SNY54458.1 hypothetical protein SAMN05660489_06399 [Pseudomonas sp. LAMO17WK12:I10]